MVQALGSGAVTLSGNVLNAGMIEAVGGGLVFDDLALTNTGRTITIADGSELTLSGTNSVVGGAIVAQGTGQVRIRQSTDLTLLDATIAGTVFQSHLDSPTATTIHGALIHDGTWTVSAGSGRYSGNYTALRFAGDAMLGGAGEIVLAVQPLAAGRSATALLLVDSGTLIHPAGHTIRGRGGILDNAGGSLVNQGTIIADTGTLTIDPADGQSFTNQGTLRAVAFLDIGALTNLVGTELVGGTYEAVGTLRLPGDVVTNSAQITLDGGNSNITTPTSSNALANLATNSATGRFELRGGRNFSSVAGLANGGRVAIAAGSTLTVNGPYALGPGSTTEVDGSLIAASSPTALAAPAMALAGLASMALQLGWMRAMAQLLGSSVYAFSTTLAVFLAGLGLGGALFSLLPSSRRPRSWHLGLTLALTGLAAAGSYLVIDWLPGLALQLHRMVRPDILGTVAPTAGLAGLVILPPTLLMGLALPLASALEAHRRDALGRGLSAVYSANTAGCIAGAALAGLVAIPFLGVQLTLKLAALAYLAAALLVWPRAWPALLPGLAVLILPAWNLALIANGPGVYSDFLARARSTNTLRPPAFYRDGLSSTVTVNVYGPNEQALRVNGKVDASLGLPDMQTMLLLGYIPAAYHVGLRKAVVIGLGSGFSLRALANLSALERLDCVELEPAVVEAGRYWAGYNGRVLEDPRLRMHLTDGRTFIQASREKYDLIASEPSNPWIAGVANLYTREFYLSCVQRLEPGGIMAQWVQLYGLSQQDLHSVLRTFFEVFPHGAVWQTSSGDLLLLGSLTPLPFDLARLEKLSAASPAIRRDLAAIQLYRPAMLLGHYLGERDPFYAAFRAAPRNTDDRPRLEFTAPFGLFRDNTPGNLLSLDLARTGQSPLPPGVDPSPERRIEAAHGQVNLNRVGDIQLLAPLKDVPGCSLVAARSAEREQDELTPRLYEQALQEQPDDPVTLWLSALYLLTRGNLADGAKLLARLEKSPPDGLEESVLVVRAQVLHRLGRLQEAEACLLRAIGLKTGYSTAWTWLGRIQAASNKPQAALESFEQALSLNAYDPDARAGKTLALMALKRFPEAITAARAMLELQSDNAEGWMYLSTALQASGDARGSEQARARARQLDPKIGRPDQLFEPPDKNQLPQR
ncbi:hypothetical protein DYH09_31935 [bacterium CPR1]|nr:hypothetical protein [bacterium CPR1]